MSEDEKNVVKVAMAPGETTSEHAARENTGWWSKLLMICGIITALGPQIIVQLQGTPLAETKTGASTLTILGFAVTIAGLFVKGMADASYINGRSTIKAAAMRDIPSGTSATTPPGV